MSLPPLPEPIFRYYNWQTESSLPSYSADQMREYGQQCYEQGLLDAMNAISTANPARPYPSRADKSSPLIAA